MATSQQLAYSFRYLSLDINRRAKERKKKPDRRREMLLDWLTKKEYKMDYLQLKWMAEDRTKYRR